MRSLAEGRGQLVIEGDDEFVGAVEIAVRTLALESETFVRIVAAMQPEDLASAGTAVQAQLSAQAELSEEFGMLSAAEVARRAASQARNTSALATRWRTQRRVFCVAVRHVQHYPAFMFDEHGQPLAVIAEVMATASHLGGWGLALWFTGASERLGGARPVDRLRSDAGAVLAAASEARAALATF
ncbi:MAG: hypothetical protein ACYDHB_09065 [Candidatus Dormibacteria bacterium]